MGALALFLVVLATAPPSPERVRAAVDGILADDRYQTEVLPGEGSGSTGGGEVLEGISWDVDGRRGGPGGDGTSTDGSDGAGGGRERWRSRRSRRVLEGRPADDGGRPWSIDFGGLPAGLGAVVEALFWLGAAVALALIVFWIVRALLDRRREPDEATRGRRRKASGPEPGPENEGARLRGPLGDAEAIAREGRFGEAIHVLLLRTLEELARWRRSDFEPSLTSREIVPRVRLDERPRVALEGRVGAVERSLFAGREPGRVEYDGCLERFRVLEAACAATPAASA